MILITFLFYLYLLTIFWHLNLKFSMIYLLVPAFALLFYYCGVLTGQAKRNWFIGIRTPWTLSNEVVWDKTHLLAAKLFKITGLITLLGLLWPDYAIFLVIGPVIIVSLGTIIYSYLEYQKQMKIK